MLTVQRANSGSLWTSPKIWEMSRGYRRVTALPGTRSAHPGRPCPLEYAAGGKPDGVQGLRRLTGCCRGTPRTRASGASSGDDTRALALCRDSLILCQKLDNKSQIAFCLTTLAGIIQAVGDAVRATRHFGAAERLLQSLEVV